MWFQFPGWDIFWQILRKYEQKLINLFTFLPKFQNQQKISVHRNWNWIGPKIGIYKELERFWADNKINWLRVKRESNFFNAVCFNVEISCWEFKKSFIASSAANLLNSLPWPDGFNVITSEPTYMHLCFNTTINGQTIVPAWYNRNLQYTRK